MQNKEYQRHREIANDIGKELKQKVKEKFGRYKDAAEKLAQLDGISVSTATQKIGEYCGGELYLISSERSTEPNERTLEHIASLYKLLGLDEEDEIVKRTQEINSNFVYSLPKEESK